MFCHLVMVMERMQDGLIKRHSRGKAHTDVEQFNTRPRLDQVNDPLTTFTTDSNAGIEMIIG